MQKGFYHQTSLVGLIYIAILSVTIPNFAQELGRWTTSGPFSGNPDVSKMVAHPDLNIVYAGTENEGVYRTVNEGLTWEPAQAPLDTKPVHDLIWFESFLYAGTPDGIYKSSDGISWAKETLSVDSLTIKTLFIFNDRLHAGSFGSGVFQHDNDMWQQANAPLNDGNIQTFETYQGTMYAGVENVAGIYYSSDGLNWDFTPFPLTTFEQGAYKMVSTSGIILAATDEDVFASSNGTDWEPTNIPVPGILDFEATNNEIYAATGYGFLGRGLYVSSLPNILWELVEVEPHLDFLSLVPALLYHNGVLYASVVKTYIDLPANFFIYAKEDNTQEWRTLNIPNLREWVTSFTGHVNTVYANTLIDGVLIQKEFGQWFKTNKFRPTKTAQLVQDFNVLLTYGDDGIFASNNGGVSWFESGIFNNHRIKTATSDNGILYVGTDLNINFNSLGLLTSTSRGVNWDIEERFSGISVLNIWKLREHLFVYTGLSGQISYIEDMGLFQRLSSGEWIQRLIDPFTRQPTFVTAMTSENGNFYAAIDPSRDDSFYELGILYSTDQGSNWEAANIALNSPIQEFYAAKNKIYAVASEGGLYYSDDGINWLQSQLPLDTPQIASLLVVGETLYTVTALDGIFSSTDGISWIRFSTQPFNSSITSLTSKNRFLYFGTKGKGVFRLDIDTNTWTPLSSGLNTREIADLNFFSTLNRLFAATDMGVYSQTVDQSPPSESSILLGGTITSTREIEVALSSEGADSVLLSENPDFPEVSWMPFDNTKPFSLSLQDGSKTVHAKFKDLSFNESTTTNAQIILDTTPPSFPGHSTPVDIQIGDSMTIHQEVVDANLDDFYLEYRRAGQTWNRNRRSFFDNNVATIEDVFITNRGIDYRIIADDLAGHETTLNNGPFSFFSIPVKLNIADLEGSPSLPSGTKGSAYRLISIPMRLANPADAKTVFGIPGEYGDEGDWRFWQYNGNGNWSEGSDIPINNGEGYFILLRNGGSLTNNVAGTTMATTAGLTNEISGWQLRENDWTIIGNPYKTRIELSQLKLAQQDINLSAHDTLSQLQIWAYDGSGSGGGWTTEDLALEQWGGLAIRVMQDDAIVFADAEDPYRLSNAKRRSSLHFTETDMKANEWLLKIYAESDGYVDEFNFLGVKADARTEQDRYDSYEPPLAPGGFSLNFPRSNWQASGRLAIDIRSSAENGHIWLVHLVGNAGQLVKVRFEDVRKIPEHINVLLIKEGSFIKSDVRKDSEFILRVPEGRQYAEFKIIAGTSDFIEQQVDGIETLPEQFALHQNFPNPFNSSTIIRYALPVKGKVTLTVFDALGRQITRLVDGEIIEPGFYESILDMREYAGGVYFYRISVTGKQVFQQARKFVIVK